MSTRLVESATRFLDGKVSRRGFLRRAAWVGTAIVAAPATYLFRPVTAQAAVLPSQCGPNTPCNDGWTDFCINLPGHSVNTCPPGSMIAGWWRAEGNGPYCNGGVRYFMDCNGSSCSCGCGSSGTCAPSCTEFPCQCNLDSCDHRKVGCTRFRYGQCNNHEACLGPIVCRVVTCIPPWEWDSSCTTTTAVANATYNHPPASVQPDMSPKPATPARIGVVTGNAWQLRNSASAGGADATFTFGSVGDRPVMGDYSNAGVRTAGMVRNTRFGIAGTEGNLIWYLRQVEGPGNPDLVIEYGSPGDFPVVGDWDRDGVSEIGVVRGNRWLLRNRNSAGSPDIDITFSGWQQGDIPVVGDWDGDGRTGIGYARVQGGQVRWLLRDTLNSGGAEYDFTFGSGGSGHPVAGDWNGDGIWGVGWFSGGTWQIRNSLSPGSADSTFSFGNANGIPVTWTRLA